MVLKAWENVISADNPKMDYNVTWGHQDGGEGWSHVGWEEQQKAPGR